MEQMTAQRRRMRVAEHQREAQRLLDAKRAAEEAQQVGGPARPILWPLFRCCKMCIAFASDLISVLIGDGRCLVIGCTMSTSLPHHKAFTRTPSKLPIACAATGPGTGGRRGVAGGAGPTGGDCGRGAGTAAAGGSAPAGLPPRRGCSPDRGAHGGHLTFLRTAHRLPLCACACSIEHQHDWSEYCKLNEGDDLHCMASSMSQPCSFPHPAGPSIFAVHALHTTATTLAAD